MSPRAGPEICGKTRRDRTNSVISGLIKGTMWEVRLCGRKIWGTLFKLRNVVIISILKFCKRGGLFIS